MNKTPIIYPLSPINLSSSRVVFSKGEDIYLYDKSGKRYIDANSGLWNVPLGYGREELTKALSEQAARLSYVNLITESSVITESYAKQLIDGLQGDFSRVVYTCSGSESVECAIKIARKYQYLNERKNANRILTFDMSYHGTTYAAMTASGMDNEEVKEYGPLNGKISYLKTPFFPGYESEEEERQCYLEDLKQNFQKHDVAAVIIEPVIASGGIIQIPVWYRKALFEIIEKEKALFIVDEVATGFGRTGYLFKYMDYEKKPDILCLSKAITNGIIAMGVVLVNNKVEECYEMKNEYLNHFSTQCGNPIACAVAAETLYLLQKDGCMEQICKLGLIFKEILQEKLINMKCVREIRQYGLMIGIDLIDKDQVPIKIERLNEMYAYMVRQGIITYIFTIPNVTSGLTLMPPYNMKKKEVEHIITIIAKTLRVYCIY